jgi:hypothetical protein
MTSDELRQHIESSAPGGRIDPRRLSTLIVSTCWPGGSEDRSEPAALDWIRHWRPERIAAELPACSCLTGRCVVCN